MNPRSTGRRQPRSIQVNIDTVVLDGVQGVDKAEFAQQLQTQLRQLIRERGLGNRVVRGHSQASLDGGQTAPALDEAAAVVAQRVFECVNKRPEG